METAENPVKLRPMRLDENRWLKLKLKVGNVTHWFERKVDEELAPREKPQPAAEPIAAPVAPAPTVFVPPATSPMVHPSNTDDWSAEEGVREINKALERAGSDARFEETEPAAPVRQRVNMRKVPLDTGGYFELPFYKLGDDYFDSDDKPLPAQIVKSLERGILIGAITLEEI